MLSTMGSNQVLETVRCYDTLRLCRTKEVVFNGVGVISEWNFDGIIEAMKVTVVARALVRLIFLHQRNELLRGSTVGLEVVLVRRRGTSIYLSSPVSNHEVEYIYAYHEVDGRSTSENVGAWDDYTPAIEVLRGWWVVKGGCLAIQLHVPRIDTRMKDPWVVQVAFSSFDQENLEIVVQVRQTTRNYTACRTATADDDVDLIWSVRSITDNKLLLVEPLEVFANSDIPHLGSSSWTTMLSTIGIVSMLKTG
jgi:hypothetical protein